MLPEPEGEIRLFTERMSLLPAKIGMSTVDAVTVGSEPNLIYASALVVFVTTTESPPPERGAFEEALPTDTLIVPVGRKGLTEPIGMRLYPFVGLSRCVPR
jgi:hypothetical protein